MTNQLKILRNILQHDAKISLETIAELEGDWKAGLTPLQRQRILLKVALWLDNGLHPNSVY